MFSYVNASIIYVAQESGNDEYNGFAPIADKYGNGPFKTMDRALKAIATYRVANQGRPFTIALTEDYYLEKTLNFTHEMNGVTITSYNERRSLIGGKKINNWKKATFNGRDCYSAQLPTLENGKKWDFSDFWVNRKRAVLTRYPKEGELKIVDSENNVDAMFPGSKWIIVDKKDLEGLKGIEKATLNFYHFWIDEHTPIESYDANSGKLVLKHASRYAIASEYEQAATTKYYLSNLPCAFGEPNEFYLDVENGIVYYLPEDDMNVNALEGFIPTLNHLIDVKGAKDIRFIDLDLFCTNGDMTFTKENEKGEIEVVGGSVQAVVEGSASITFEQSQRCVLSDCHLHGLGIYAVEIKNVSKNIRIENCVIEDIGAGGIKIIGEADAEEEALMTSNCVVRNNIIRECGKRHTAGCGILICHANNNEISENEIYNIGYSGISAGFVWGYGKSNTYGNIIRKNHIHHIGGKISDLGGVYLLGKQEGTIVAENRIHDIYCATYNGCGIYLDEGTSYVIVENNVVYGTQTTCLSQHYGSYNLVRNNIFFSYGDSVCTDIGRHELHDCILYENNILITNGTAIYNEPEYNIISTSKNILWDITSKSPKVRRVWNRKYFEFEEWQTVFHQDMGSVVADPMFKDVLRFDFTLAENSPAKEVGFKPLKGFLATGRKEK